MGSITKKVAAELLNSNLIIYLSILVILIIFLTNLFWNYYKNKKNQHVMENKQ